MKLKILNRQMKYLLFFSIVIGLLFTLGSCGESSTTEKTPNNFPDVKKKVSSDVHKPFGRGISHQITTFQQYYEAGGKKPEKHLITLSKPTKERELKLKLPLDMEKLKNFRRIETSKFEGSGPIQLDNEHLYKNHNQIDYWKYHKDGTPTKVLLQEGTYSYILKNDFEMIHIYDSANDIEYMEMKM